MKPDPRFSIYALRCPIDGLVKYVGVSQNLKQRYLGHWQSPNKCTREWVLKLREAGQFFIMDELEAGIPKSKAGARERYWINKINTEQGGGLLNIRHLAPTVTPRELPINYINQDDNN